MCGWVGLWESRFKSTAVFEMKNHIDLRSVCESKVMFAKAKYMLLCGIDFENKQGN